VGRTLAQNIEDWCAESKLLSRVIGLVIGDTLYKLIISISFNKANQRITYFLLLLFNFLLPQGWALEGWALAQLTPDTTLGSLIIELAY
jgi:hypothetical protein